MIPNQSYKSLISLKNFNLFILFVSLNILIANGFYIAKNEGKKPFRILLITIIFVLKYLI
jgi:hypothetical protein